MYSCEYLVSVIESIVALGLHSILVVLLEEELLLLLQQSAIISSYVAGFRRFGGEDEISVLWLSSSGVDDTAGDDAVGCF